MEIVEDSGGTIDVVSKEGTVNRVAKSVAFMNEMIQSMLGDVEGTTAPSGVTDRLLKYVLEYCQQ